MLLPPHMQPPALGLIAPPICAVLSGVALLQLGLLLRPLMFVILAAWVLGSALFSGDIALRAFTGHRLFALAAPTGGIILIVAWLGLVAAAVGALVRS